MAQDMAAILTQARNSPMILALASASAAQAKMACTLDTDAYCDAAAAMADALDQIRAAFLAASPHLAHALATHTARLTDA